MLVFLGMVCIEADPGPMGDRRGENWFEEQNPEAASLDTPPSVNLG